MTAEPTSAGPALLRRLNARQVLAALQRHGPMSRAEITRRTGISGPTVTRAVAELLAARLLEEGEARAAAPGRPGRVLRLASRGVSVVGLVLGARRCELAAAGLDGAPRPGLTRHFGTPSRYADLIAEAARQAADLAAASDTAVLGLGVSVPGLLSRPQGRTLVSPNLHQTDGQTIGDDLRRALGWEVTLLQESHALCRAERAYGGAVGLDDFAVLDLSEGLGLGVVQGGRLLEGHSGLAGELGHVTVELDGRPCGCGNRGCLETLATDTAFVAAVAERLGRRLTPDELWPLLRDGAVRADAEQERALRYLAVGVAAVINLFNPARVFLYGRLLDAPGAFERLLELTRPRALGPSLADCQVLRARGSKLLGAVAGVVHRLTVGR
jgi:N-acetylglucosamine repressor